LLGNKPKAERIEQMNSKNAQSLVAYFSREGKNIVSGLFRAHAKECERAAF